MCCGSTAKVDEIGEKVICKYDNIEKICVPIFMDDIVAIRNAKRNKKLKKNGNREKNTIWTEKDKIYDNNNWKRETRANRRRGKGRKGRKESRYIQLLRSNAKQKNNLKEHIKETENKASRIIREINMISSKQQSLTDDLKEKTKVRTI